MSKLYLLLGLLLVIGAYADVEEKPLVEAVEEEPLQARVQFVNKNELKTILANFPDAVKLDRTIKYDETRAGQSREIITYVMGSRVSTDTRVYHASDGYAWVWPQDVRLTVAYPSSGTGKIVSYVEINVFQSNDSGDAYVTKGGIGQRYITFFVEAQNTFWFNYDISIYGY